MCIRDRANQQWRKKVASVSKCCVLLTVKQEEVAVESGVVHCHPSSCSMSPQQQGRKVRSCWLLNWLSWCSVSICLQSLCSSVDKNSFSLTGFDRKFLKTCNVLWYSNVKHYCRFRILHSGSKKLDPTIFANNFNKYWSISIIFGRWNLQCLHV